MPNINSAKKRSILRKLKAKTIRSFNRLNLFLRMKQKPSGFLLYLTVLFMRGSSVYLEKTLRCINTVLIKTQTLDPCSHSLAFGSPHTILYYSASLKVVEVEEEGWKMIWNNLKKTEKITDFFLGCRITLLSAFSCGYQVSVIPGHHRHSSWDLCSLFRLLSCVKQCLTSQLRFEGPLTSPLL